MRHLNTYYVISTITLVFMMLLMGQTLKVRGWFDEPREKSPGERLYLLIQGDYIFSNDSTSENGNLSISKKDSADGNWLKLSLDTRRHFELNVNNFEDEQVLIEIYQVDSTGHSVKLEGCELLLSDDENDQWTGSTLGEFCAYNQELSTYYSMAIKIAQIESSLELEKRNYDGHALLSQEHYTIRRSGHHE